VHLRISLANIAVTKVGLQELGITQQSQWMNPVENRLYETDDTMKAICARSVACIGSLDAQETNRSTHGPVDGYVFFFFCDWQRPTRPANQHHFSSWHR
jgi:hypothetical protein